MKQWMLALLLVLTVRSPLALAERVEDSVVRLHVSKHELDRSAPWQHEEVVQQSALGVVVGNNLILTTAFGVADASFLEIQRFGASSRHEAQVLFADYEVNLALVKPVLPSALARLRPASLGDDLAIDDQVDIYKYRDASQLSRVSASLQEVGLFAAVTSSNSLVSYLLKAQQTGLGWAEPVFRQGRLVGLTTGQDANYVHAVPMATIKHFLDDKYDQSYRGFPSLGVTLSPLVSPDMRRLLGAEKVEEGVRIAEVDVAGSAHNLLQADDVLLSVDGQEVDDHGFVAHGKWGKVHLKHSINQHYAGDEIKLKALRHGQELVLDCVLKRFDSNRAPVIAYRYGKPEPYLIFGGLVFQELSQDFLKQWGKDWRELAPFELLYAFDFGNKPSANAERRIIFMPRVLADEYNRGYADLRFQIVDTVNDQKITSMTSLAEALQKPMVKRGRHYARIQFIHNGGEVILSYDGLEAAQKRISKTYEIKAPEAFFALKPNHREPTPVGPLR